MGAHEGVALQECISPKHPFARINNKFLKVRKGAFSHFVLSQEPDEPEDTASPHTDKTSVLKRPAVPDSNDERPPVLRRPAASDGSTTEKGHGRLVPLAAHNGSQTLVLYIKYDSKAPKRIQILNCSRSQVEGLGDCPTQTQVILPYACEFVSTNMWAWVAECQPRRISGANESERPRTACPFWSTDASVRCVSDSQPRPT